MDEHIDRILNPKSDNAKVLVEQLGLAHLPSTEELYQEIEGKLLLPQEKLPDHWLAKYQMYDWSSVEVLC